MITHSNLLSVKYRYQHLQTTERSRYRLSDISIATKVAVLLSAEAGREVAMDEVI